MKILVIQQKMIGDVLTSSILFEVLKKEYPEAELHYLILANTFSVVQHNPYIDKFIFFPKEAENSVLELYKFGLQIQQLQFNIVIDVYAKLSSIIITRLAKAKTTITYTKPYTKKLYTYTHKRGKTPKTKAGLAIEDRLQLLYPIVSELPQWIKPKIYLTAEEINQAQQFLTSNHIRLDQPLIMISVLGSSENKSYPFEYMAEVIDTVVESTQAQILFNYIPSQTESATVIYKACKAKTQQHIFFDVYGKSLRDFLAILHHCQAIIGNEGGAINMAKALQIKTFTIFSPWIDKKTWSIFEDEANNKSVHLKEYCPELYGTKPEKKMKNEALNLYKAFLPKFFKTELLTFLKPFKI